VLEEEASNAAQVSKERIKPVHMMLFQDWRRRLELRYDHPGSLSGLTLPRAN
jgi:hypothetical protein